MAPARLQIHPRTLVVRENLICRFRGAREATCPRSRLVSNPFETHPDTVDHANQGFGVSDAEVEAHEAHDHRGMVWRTNYAASE